MYYRNSKIWVVKELLQENNKVKYKLQLAGQKKIEEVDEDDIEGQV